MKNVYKATMGIGLAYLALTAGCQQIRPTRDSHGRVTKSAQRMIEADEIDQERIYRGIEHGRPITFPLCGGQFR